MDYWARRNAETIQRATSRNIKETETRLAEEYQKSMEKIIGQFEKIYNQLKESMLDGKEPTPADLYKLNTYWEFQGTLQKELEKLGNSQTRILSYEFRRQYGEIYRLAALKGEKAFTTLDLSGAQQAINEIWCADGKNWSSRIWENTNKLVDTLNENLINCVLTGKKTSQLLKVLEERFNVSYNQANTVVRTEMAHIQTESAKKRYTDYGIKEVEVFVNSKERLCKDCEKLIGKRFPINGKMPVPVHPNCRCCIVPVIED